MDEISGMRFLSTLMGGGIDWSALIAFLVIGLVAFLSPVVGYEKRPRGITASLIFLIAYMVFGLIEYIVLFYAFYDQPSDTNFRRSGVNSKSVFFFFFTVGKQVLFVAAMITFGAGVLALRVRKPKPNTEPVASELENK